MLTNNLFTPPFLIHRCSQSEKEILEIGEVPTAIKENKHKHKDNNVLYIYCSLYTSISNVWTIEKDVVIYHGYISRNLLDVLLLPNLFDRFYNELEKINFTNIVNSNFASTHKEVYERIKIPSLNFY